MNYKKICNALDVPLLDLYSMTEPASDTKEY